MKIFCIGRNYADHAKELNNPVPQEPVIFMKPHTALLKDNRPFYYPEFSKDIHYEAEIVLKISKNGKHIQQKFASAYYEEYTVGIDFTARDIQQKCKEKGLPWEKAKAFDNSAATGIFIKKGNEDNVRFTLNKNGKKVQSGNTRDLLFSFEELISYISQYFTLNKGDLIFTGTPAGVGPVSTGDMLEGHIEGNLLLSCEIK